MLGAEEAERWSKNPVSVPRTIADATAANRMRLSAGALQQISAVGAEPSAETQRRSIATSCADWKLSAGSLARQPATTSSSIGGARTCVALIGSGSFSRIAVKTLSWDLPSNARRPVTIS